MFAICAEIVQVSPMREEEQAGSGLVGVALFLYICGYCAGVSDEGGGAGWLRSGGCGSLPRDPGRLPHPRGGPHHPRLLEVRRWFV